jgi:cytochrome c oxidase cbb3-type subunit IV
MIPGVITAILLIAFLAGCVWVYSPRRHSEFSAAERLALDDVAPQPTQSSSEASP